MDDELNYATKEEMDSFIKGLFSDNRQSESYDLTIPTIDPEKNPDVEFATDTEVKLFITGLFTK